MEGLDIGFKLMVRCKDVLVGFAAKAQRREGEDEFLGGIIGRVVGTFYYPKDHFVERPYTRLSNFVPRAVNGCSL